MESYRRFRGAWRKRGSGRYNGKLPVTQRRVVTEKEEERQRAIQWKVTGDSDARGNCQRGKRGSGRYNGKLPVIQRRVIIYQQGEAIDARWNFPIEPAGTASWKVFADTQADAYKILMESFDGARVRPRAYISWQSDPLRTEYIETDTDTVAERIDGRVRFISSSDTESLRIGW